MSVFSFDKIKMKIGTTKHWVQKLIWFTNNEYKLKYTECYCNVFDHSPCFFVGNVFVFNNFSLRQTDWFSIFTDHLRLYFEGKKMLQEYCALHTMREMEDKLLDFICLFLLVLVLLLLLQIF